MFRTISIFTFIFSGSFTARRGSSPLRLTVASVLEVYSSIGVPHLFPSNGQRAVHGGSRHGGRRHGGSRHGGSRHGGRRH